VVDEALTTSFQLHGTFSPQEGNASDTWQKTGMRSADIHADYRQAGGLIRSGQLEEAAAELRRIVFNHPDFADARASLGSCQLLMGDVVNAEQSFIAALQMDPAQTNALFGLANLLLSQSRIDEARQLAEHLLRHLPENASAHALFAETILDDPQPANPIAAFRRALDRDPACLSALLGLARLYLKRRRVPEAADLVEEALAEYPKSAEAFDLLSEIHSRNKEPEQALSALASARLLDPASPALAVRNSELSRQIGESENALKHAIEAIELGADGKVGGNALGAALAALGYQTDAREILKSAAVGEPVVERVLDRTREILRNAEIKRLERIPEEPTFPGF